MKRLPFFLIMSAVLVGVYPAHAAELLLQSKSVVTLGDQIQAIVAIDTKGESLNAFEGSILFSGDVLEVQEIRTGDSLVNFWVERPAVQQGKIRFSGVTPGGYKGDNGQLMAVIFKTRSVGTALIRPESMMVLKNDGKGTPVEVQLAPLEISIAPASQHSPVVLAAEDREMPEIFTPVVTSDLRSFDGRAMLVFGAQDKQSGVDHYEIKETRQKLLPLFSSWFTGESPYLLRDQDLHSYIYVKAVDHAGNAQIAQIPPEHPLPWYTSYEYWLLIAGGIGVIAIIRFLL
jgi:hypothetical protein